MFHIGSPHVLLLLISASVCASSGVVTFTEQKASATQSHAFDVVSIRPSGAQETEGFGASEDQYHGVGPLRMLIMQAYFPSAFWQQNRIKNAPQWVASDRYTFVGKVASSDLAAWRSARRSWGAQTSAKPNIIQTMLRTALEDRCKLVVHRIPGEADGLELVIDRHGPNLKTLVSAKPDDAIPANAALVADGGRVVPMFKKMVFYRTSMSELAGYLSATWRAHVEDRTNLKDNYNFVLTQWGDDPSDLTGIFDFGSLGLKIERAKVPMDNLVIDHIERPTAN